MKTRHCSLIVLGIIAITSLGYGGETKQGDKNTLKKVNDFLEGKYPKKKWQQGPKQIDTPEIRKAYSGLKFYHVFTAPPLPPGAALPELIKAYQQKLRDIRENYLSLTLRLSKNGDFIPLKKKTDFQKGLMAIKSTEDARIAAAAVLSVFGSGRVGPGKVSSTSVKVNVSEGNFICTAKPNRFSFGQVVFDGNGNILRLSKQYVGPFPP